MYVITFANPKGGTGKTTCAMLLAEQIASAGGRVAVLDLDPNANILAWAQTRKAAERSLPFAVYARPPAEDIVTLIDSLADAADYLIADLEGSKDQIVTFALSRTDLCLIPLDGSAMEARQAAQAVKLVQSTEAMIRRAIAYQIVFARTNAAFPTNDERDVRAAMAANQVPTLPVRIAKRALYTRLFRDAVLLAELPALIEVEMRPRGKSAVKKGIQQAASAIEDARIYAQAVINQLTRST